MKKQTTPQPKKEAEPTKPAGKPLVEVFAAEASAKSAPSACYDGMYFRREIRFNLIENGSKAEIVAEKVAGVWKNLDPHEIVPIVDTTMSPCQTTSPQKPS